MAQTLAQLRTEAQQRSNQENKTLVATSEWNRYLNEAIAELYDLIVSSFPHYYVSSSPFTLSSSNRLDLTTLSPIFYKLRAVDFLVTPSRPRDVRPFNFAERNRFSQLVYSGSYTLWYTPVPPVLVQDSDTLDSILDVWSEFIPITAAIAAAVKEESPIDGFAAQKAAIIARINAAAPNRDGEPGQAADLTGPFVPGESGRRYALEGTNLIILGSDYDLWAYV